MKWASSKLWAFGTGKLCFTDSIQRVLGVQGPLLVSGGIFIWHSALSRIKVLGTGHLGSHLTSGASTGSHYSSCIHSPLIAITSTRQLRRNPQGIPIRNTQDQWPIVKEDHSGPSLRALQAPYLIAGLESNTSGKLSSQQEHG